MGRAALAVALAFAAGAPNAGQGDARRGEEVYARCAACHSLAHDRVGPRHCGLLGRRAGSLPHFDYSAAMKASRIVWTPQALDRFLADPMKRVPGTTMTYAGVPGRQERADLIAYLAAAGKDASECKPLAN